MEQVYFRASGAGALLTEPRSKADKDAGLLGETAKTFVRETWLQNKYGYREVISTDEMLKGNLCEQDSMQLLTDLDGMFRTSFKKNIKQGCFSGTPDIIIEQNGIKIVEDVKTSFTKKTFMEASCTTLYETQLRVYMYLTGATKARLCYCLIDTPEEIVQELVKRAWFKYGCDDENKDFQKAEAQIRLNHDNSMIPKEDRVKIFEFDHDPEIIEKLQLQAVKAIKYYNTLSINMK